MMFKPLLALAVTGLMIAAAPAQAGNVSWSVGIGGPGVGAVVSGGPGYHHGHRHGGYYRGYAPRRVYAPLPVVYGPAYRPFYAAGYAPAYAPVYAPAYGYRPVSYYAPRPIVRPVRIAYRHWNRGVVHRPVPVVRHHRGY